MELHDFGARFSGHLPIPGDDAREPFRNSEDGQFAGDFTWPLSPRKEV
jgi:hypothetical protein